jgi:hypothetical protein
MMDLELMVVNVVPSKVEEEAPAPSTAEAEAIAGLAAVPAEEGDKAEGSEAGGEKKDKKD